VDDQLRALDELDEVFCDLLEARLVRQEFIGDTVDFDRALVDLPVRLDITVKVVAGQAAVIQLDTADLDDAMPLGDFQACGFRIQYDLAQLCLLLLLSLLALG